jgi:hypothetical protein
MEQDASILLKVILDKCRGAAVSEVRFVSGMNPAFVDSEGPHFLDTGDLSRELVDDVHGLCLSLADADVAKSGATSTYAFSLKHLGQIRCEYRYRGNAASLILMLDPDAAATVDAVRPKRSPSMRAEAKPDSNGDGQ